MIAIFQSRKLFKLTLWVVLLQGPVRAQPGERAEPYRTLGNDGKARYDLVLPADYDAGKTYPLLVTLHGATMDSSAMVLYWRPAASVQKWIVCCPKSIGQTWQAGDVSPLLRIVHHLRQEYAVDPNEILLHGYSDGGTWAWRLGLAHPELFKGIAMFSGAFNRTFLPPNRIRPMPVFILHGQKDKIIPVSCARTAAATLKIVDYDVRLAIEPDKGHGLFEFTDHAARTLRWFSTRPKKEGKDKTS